MPQRERMKKKQMEETGDRAEAERLLGIAEKLLQGKDFTGSREFGILAQESDPLLEGTDQIIAVSDVLLAAEKKIQNRQDWYAVLQVDSGQSDDLELIRQNYRRLAFLLHPDKNKYPWADSAFRLIADAWSVMSDTAKKSIYDSQLRIFSKVDLVPQGNQMQNKLPVRRSSGKRGKAASDDGETRRNLNFWTVCPYCYNLYEYPRVYVDCCLRCQGCERAFHAVVISSLPPLVPGKDEYYCCWGFFPLEFVAANRTPQPAPATGAAGENGGFVHVSEANVAPVQAVPRKRGRPKKKV